MCQVFLRVIVPAAAPGIFSGLRIALVIAVVCEMISATEGLGWLIGYALDRLLALARNRLTFWERERVSIGLS